MHNNHIFYCKSHFTSEIGQNISISCFLSNGKGNYSLWNVPGNFYFLVKAMILLKWAKIILFPVSWKKQDIEWFILTGPLGFYKYTHQLKFSRQGHVHSGNRKNNYISFFLANRKLNVSSCQVPWDYKYKLVNFDFLVYDIVIHEKAKQANRKWKFFFLICRLGP